MNYPCDMSLSYPGDSWQDHCDRPGYLAKGWEPGQDFVSKAQNKIPLYAILDGKVIRDKDSGYNDGYGVYCDIDHGVVGGHRYRSLYAHMDGNFVSVGQTVKAGQQIGVMGTSGNSDCIHLHFILWVDGKNVDPMPYLSSNLVQPPVVVEPTAPAEFVMPVIPFAPRYRVASDTLNFRTLPIVANHTYIRPLNHDDQLFIFGSYTDPAGNVWLAVGEDDGDPMMSMGWVAAYYNGQVWLQPVV